MSGEQLEALECFANCKWLINEVGPSIAQPSKIMAAENLLAPNGRAVKAIGDERVRWFRLNDAYPQFRRCLRAERDQTYDDFLEAITPLVARMRAEVRRRKKANANDRKYLQAVAAGEIRAGETTYQVIDFDLGPDKLADEALRIERSVRAHIERSWETAITEGRVLRLMRGAREDSLLMTDEAPRAGQLELVSYALTSSLPEAVQKIAENGPPRMRGTRSLEVEDRPYVDLAFRLISAEPTLSMTKAVQKAVETIGETPHSANPESYEPRIRKRLSQKLKE